MRLLWRIALRVICEKTKKKTQQPHQKQIERMEEGEEREGVWKGFRRKSCHGIAHNSMKRYRVIIHDASRIDSN